MLMPLSLLSKFLATLLVPVTLTAVVTTVMNQTLLNSQYIEGKLAATNSYQRLSVALSDEIGKKAPDFGSQQVSTALQSVLTPEALKTKINGALDQMQAYYRGETAQLPTIDLTELGARAQAMGLPVAANSEITRPIQLPVGNRLRDYNHNLQNAQRISTIGATVLAAALLAVSWRRQNWKALPNVLIVVGVLLGIGAGVAAGLSGAVTHFITADSTSNAFSLLGRDLGTAIASDLAKRIGIIAAIFGVVGIVSRILVGRLSANKMTTPTTSVSPRQAPTIIN